MLYTGEAVRLDLRPARVPTRAVSAAVDLTCLLVLSLLWARATEELDGSPAATAALGSAGYLLICFVVPVAVETLSRGRTPGRWATGLRVVRDDGGVVRLRHAVTRWLAFWLVDFSPLTLGLLGLVVAGAHPQGKRVGDLLAGTVVVRVRSPRQPPLPPEPASDLEGWRRRLELSGLPDDLLAAARTVVRRSAEMRRPPRQALLDDLARQVYPRLSPP
ncbi:RDD family protein, partial [Desertihabitans aurantiacus]|uniref:RDD family protein n=1 Tax=Desertihabitans aurantiacus TaxID=2282477 RepID=UPI000DF74DD1